ncbi:DUF1738 domain-containing protein [Campylobacter sp. W0049]|uniref:ArdC-like ssDNA-binding domain-containing protein n=1 Tax=Campylobacter molothri TaxID=1032242 RepID=UPI00301C7C1B|nr:DUF1738 domain-containing protein [Campylobacter sp. W0049]
MAKRKNATKEIQEKVEEQTQNNSFKAWDERTNEEKRASINEYSKAILAKAIKEKATFWNKDLSQKEIDETIPYNASKGIVYTGATSALLRAVTALNGYEKPSFLTMKQANFLGGKLKKLLDDEGKPIKTKNGKEAYVTGVKIAILKSETYTPKLDEKGNPMFRDIKDKEGNIKLDEKGNPMREQVMEKVYLKNPVLETITLYHTSQFEGLQTKKLKDRDLNKLQEMREHLKKSNYDTRPNINHFKLGERATRDINNFLNSELKGMSYVKIQDRENTQTNTQKQEKKQGMAM